MIPIPDAALKSIAAKVIPTAPVFAPPNIGLAPVPCTIMAVQLQLNGMPAVGLQIATPIGVACHFLSCEQARAVGHMLLDVAGLVHVPRGGV